MGADTIPRGGRDKRGVVDCDWRASGGCRRSSLRAGSGVRMKGGGGSPDDGGSAARVELAEIERRGGGAAVSAARAPAASGTTVSSSRYAGFTRPSAIWRSISASSGSQKPSKFTSTSGLAWNPSWRSTRISESSSSVPKPPGKRDEGVAAMGERRLPAAHVADGVEDVQPLVRDAREGVEDDALDASAARERRVGELAHEADAGAAVDEQPAALGDAGAEVARQGAKRRRCFRRRGGIDGDAADRRHGLFLAWNRRAGEPCRADRATRRRMLPRRRPAVYAVPP